MERTSPDAAARANVAAYDEVMTRDYVRAAPHLKHPSLRRRQQMLIARTVERARASVAEPRVLDLGAGEGSVTRAFLEHGAAVTAVDLSHSQLAALEARCQAFAPRLQTHCAEVDAFLGSAAGPWDIVVATSFLHHVPDYLALVARLTPLLAPGGQLFTFQDPLRYDSLTPFTRTFSTATYGVWRLAQGDVARGIGRRLRRARGVYLDDSVHDNSEFHVTRGGVDQEALVAHLTQSGFEVDLVPYFSTQAPAFQWLGDRIGLENTFALLARRARGPAA